LERRIGRGERILDSKNLLFYFSIDEVCWHRLIFWLKFNRPGRGSTEKKVVKMEGVFKLNCATGTLLKCHRLKRWGAPASPELGNSPTFNERRVSTCKADRESNLAF
jgi:hypothetical protein